MANRDIAGLLTGISSQGIDPLATLTPEQQRLQMGAQAAQRMGGGLRGLMGGGPTVQQQLVQAQGQKMRADKAREQSRMTAFSTFLSNKYPDSGLDKLAAQGIVTPENFNDFLKDKQDANAQKGTTFTVQDVNGDNFTATSVFNPNTGKTDVSYSPIGATKSPQPVGKVQITGGEFGLTAVEDLERGVTKAGLTEREESFQKNKATAISALPAANASKQNLEKAVTLLKNTVDTGGPINLAATGLENFFGVKSGEKAQLEIILGREMMSSLKPFFGGIISDSETKRVAKIYAGLEKGNVANLGILEQLLKEVDDGIMKGSLYLRADSADDFETTLKQMFPVATKKEEQENIIDFGDLDNVSNSKR